MFVLNGVIFGVWASRIPAFVERLSLDARELGLLLLFIAVGSIVSFPIAGALSDRIGAATLSRWLAASCVVTLCLLPLAPHAWVLGVFLCLYGAAMGSLDVAMNAWAAEVERKMERSVMSSFHAMFSVGGGVGSVSGYAAVELGLTPTWHFWLAGIAVGAASLVMASIPWPSTKTGRTGHGSVFAIPKGALALVGLIAFCSSIGEGGLADWSAIFLKTVIGVSEAQAALGFAVFSATMVAMRLSGDWIIRRLGPVPTARLSGLTGMCGALLAVFGGGLLSALAGFALMGIGFATIIPLAFSRAANDPVMSPGRAIASVATFGYGGFLIGPPMIGFIAAQTSLAAAFGIIAILSAAIAVLAGSLKRP
jgi:MFS family permease